LTAAAELEEVPLTEPTPVAAGDETPTAEELGLEEKPDAEELALTEPRKRRKKANVDAFCRRWFLEYAAVKRAQCNWDIQTSLASARRIAPEIFGNVHADTPYRWRLEGASAEDLGSKGRKPSLNAGQLTVLSEQVGRVAAWVAVSVPTMRAVVNAQLDEWKIAWRPSRSWMHRFLHQMGLSYKKGAGCKQAEMSPEVQADLTENLLLKMVWLRRFHNIEESRTINVDETAMLLLPLAQRGWSPTGQKSLQCSKENQFVTVTLAMPIRQGPLLANIVFKGSTDKSLPSCVPPAGIVFGLSDNHWQTTETLVAFVKAIDAHMQAGLVEELPWLLLIDVCSVRTSDATRGRIRDEVPFCKLAFVPPRSTGFNQPLDRSVMRGLKRSMARVAGAHYAQQILEAGKKGEEVRLDLGLRTLKNVLPGWLRSAMDEVAAEARFFETGWSHLRVENLEDLLKRADCKHASGTLFRQVRANCKVHEQVDPVEEGVKEDVGAAADVVEENAADVVEEDAADVLEEDDFFQESSGEDSEAAEDLEEQAPFEDVEPPVAATASSSSTAAPRAGAARADVMERVFALRLVYGKGPR
jgi:transposase